jgi:hypothetical protein
MSLSMLGAVSARAQTNETAAARILFKEGRDLATKMQFEQACPKFEESMRLDNGIGTRFNLADCWEHVGRTASAWALFLDVASSAKAASQVDREKVARRRAAALEPRLSRLILDVIARDEKLEVRRNRDLVGPPQWGMPVPLDPGSYVIEATAPNKKPWQATIVIEANGSVARVSVPELVSEAHAASVTTTETVHVALTAGATPALNSPLHPSSHGRGTGPSMSDAPAAPSGSNALRTVGWVTAGVGLAAIGTGAVFGNLSRSSRKLTEDLCSSGPNGDQCRDDAESRDFHAANVRATNRATLAYTGFIAGGVLLSAGVVLILTAPSSDTPSNRMARRTLAAPMIGPDGWGFAMTGCW